MNLRYAAITLLASIIIANGAPAFCERTIYLNVCQELVNSARSYEARASHHARMAKVVQTQIELFAKLPKDVNTSQAIDQLFSQYDENRVLEAKFRDLYKQTSEEAKKCMKSAE